MDVTTKKVRWLNKAAAFQYLKHFVFALILVSLAAGLRVWLLENRFDLLEIAVFALVCSFISYLAEAVYRSQKKLKQVESELKASTEYGQFIRSIIENIPNMIGYWDRDLRCRYANNAYGKWFGKSPEKIVGIFFRDLTGERLFALNEPHIRRVLAGEPQRFERTLNKAGGGVGHIIGHYIPNFDADGTVKGFVTQASEVTFLKETEAKLELAACVFENTLDGVLITDADGIILSVNPAFIEITGYTAEEAVGQNPRMLQSNRHDRAFYAAMWKQIITKGRWNGEIWNRRKDGDLYLERMTISMVRDADGKPDRYVSVFSDITAFRRKDEHIKHLAFHDALTDLPNRTLLMDRINRIMINSDREPCNLALLFLDLDGFKLVNDQYGHNVGDDLLKEVAKRLLALVRESDIVARLGGDEFIVVLNNPKGIQKITSIATHVVRSINEPMEILGEVLHVGASVGIALFLADAATSADLIKNADTAMYAAKESGRNTIRFYAPDNNF
jgi:diguanylate cyclase (GGDEF)-like protein/PAS domain S-box-containing protein